MIIMADVTIEVKGGKRVVVATLSVPDCLKNLTDEEILTRFIAGFNDISMIKGDNNGPNAERSTDSQ